MKMKFRVYLSTASAVTLLLTGFAAAQAPTATIVGRIVDPGHAIVVGASIRVRDVNTNRIRTAKSNAQGEYTVSNLDPSTYDVVIAMPTFRVVHEPALVLSAGQTARLDATLLVGATTDEVVVTAEVGALNTETSDKGDVISPVEISEMPLNGRDFNDLVFNVAGVMPSEEGSKGSEFVANGARSDTTNVIVDGMNNTSPRDAGAEATPPLDSLQEFKVQTSGYSAEYGRVAGPVINLVIKKGSNTLHGSIFEFVRNDIFDARNYFDDPNIKSKLQRNQFGGTLGGPVYIPHLYNGHNKTFFLFSWESYRQVAGQNMIGIVPTVLERGGDFSQSYDSNTGKLLAPNSLKDPLGTGTGTGTLKGIFAGNKIPQGMFDPIAVSLLNFYPAPNLSGVSGNNNYRTNAKGRTSWDSFVIKLDQQLAAHDEASIRLLRREESTVKPFTGSPLGVFGSTLHNHQTIVGFTETHIITPTLINEFRSGLTRNVNDEHSMDAGPNWAAMLGIPGTTSDPKLAQFPQFKLTSYEVIGDSIQQPIQYTTNNYDTNDAVTWNKGKHTVKIGASYLRIQYFQPTNSQFSGSLAFSGKNAGNSFAEFLRGAPSSIGLRVGTVVNHLYDASYATFAQDDYKIRSNLTLNLGVRYEIQALPHEENGQLSSYVPSLGKIILASAQTVPNLSDTLAQAGNAAYVGLASDYGLPQTLIHPNYNRVAPRVGFAWRPFSGNQTVVRGGYGIFYTGSRMSAIRTEMSGQFPFSILESFTAGGKTTIGNAFNPSAASLKGINTANGYDVNAPSSYLQSWNLTFERELLKGVAVEIGYTGSQGTHLGRQIDINQQQRTATNVISCAGSKCKYPRPYDFFGSINYFSFDAFSSFHAGTVTLRKRFEHGLLFRMNYTFGKSLDTASGLNYEGKGGYKGAQDSLHPNDEYGRSNSDRRHTFTGNFVYQLPFRRNIFVRGWQSSGSFQILSGTPFTPQLTGPTQDEGVPTRPDRVCNGALPHPGPNAWFDLSCFPQVALSEYRFGNSKRDILDGPKNIVFNLSVGRNFRVTEKSKLQFRWEAFNLTNHTNFNLPDDNVDEIQAGAIASSKDSRIMQVGAKYTF